MTRIKLLSARQLFKIGTPVEWTEIDNIHGIASQVRKGGIDLIGILRTKILARGQGRAWAKLTSLQSRTWAPIEPGA